MKIRRITLFALLVALAFIFSYLEMLIPLPLPVGVKLGMANVVVLVALYLMDERSAFAVSAVRILLSGLCFGVSTIPYSLAGGVLSLGIMTIMKRSKRFGIPGVSVAGGVAHNIGQVLVAMLLLGAKSAYYFPVLFASGVVAGVVIGIISSVVLKKLQGHIR